jgi:hypothetical protein
VTLVQIASPRTDPYLSGYRFSSGQNRFGKLVFRTGQDLHPIVSRNQFSVGARVSSDNYALSTVEKAGDLKGTYERLSELPRLYWVRACLNNARHPEVGIPPQVQIPMYLLLVT